MKLSEVIHAAGDNLADTAALIGRRPGEEPAHRAHYYVWGLRRSGNHAVINWIEGMATGGLVNFNDLSLYQNPWRLALRHVRRKPEHRRMEQLRRYALYRSMDPDIARDEAQGRHRSQDLVIFSFEDYFPRHAWGRYFRLMRDARYGSAQQRKVILILRDPFNLLASRRAHHRVHAGLRRSGRTWLDCWKEYARYCADPPEDTVPVIFDRWVIDQSYRRAVAEQLGLNYNERNLHALSTVGGGSSFDGTRADKATDHSRVLGRWRELADSGPMRALRTDPEVRRYTSELFFSVPGLPDLGSTEAGRG